MDEIGDNIFHDFLREFDEWRGMRVRDLRDTPIEGLSDFGFRSVPNLVDEQLTHYDDVSKIRQRMV